MKRYLRYAGLGLLTGLLIWQFFPPERNAGVAEGPQSIVTRQKPPPPVKAILQRACYDCHSNQTRYPWYASIQPVEWWLNRHISEGKGELNFSEFSSYSDKRAVRKLSAVADEVRDRKMPLKSYRLLHREAELSDADVALLAGWADDLADEIEAH